MKTLDLFSGIGGFALGLGRAGFDTALFCENDPFCTHVLENNWPSVPIHEDVKTLHIEPGMFDLICGGFPCQDISYAGKGAGLTGARSGLWTEFLRLIKEGEPKYVIIENVSALRSRGLGSILGSLSALGYDAEWHCIPATAVGAPHQRDRLWVIAYPRLQGTEGLVTPGSISKTGSWGWRGEEDLQSVFDSPFLPRPRWPKPLVRRVDDGIPNRFHRVASCGNALVPDIAYLIGKKIMEIEIEE